MTALNRWMTACLAFGLTVISGQAQTFETVYDFSNAADYPNVALVQGRDGNLYGTTEQGAGQNYSGCVYRIKADGEMTILHGFYSFYDGTYPGAGLVLATDRAIYGTTVSGGLSGPCGGGGCGAVFKMTDGGTFTVLHKFSRDDGKFPEAALVQGTDGKLYGTTYYGGTADLGTVFQMTEQGELKTLHSFSGSDGANPETALVEDTDGNFYGTTFYGGDLDCNPPDGCGTIFKISPKGEFKTIYSFDGTKGVYPSPTLLRAADGYFYGTTYRGGDFACDPIFRGCGTIFRTTRSGTLTTLHIFEMNDGDIPAGGLIQATDGNLYGATISGGGEGGHFCDNGCGTLFRLSPLGQLTTVHAFDHDDGADPRGSLMQATTGVIYGTTWGGGRHFFGTLFSLDLGLPPFVTFVRGAGRIGNTGPILGQGLTGTTEVDLNGTPASFTVVSDTLIRATVPAGATSGYVTVSTPGGVLTSNKPFKVIQ